jgi:hypothetical protein
MPTRIALSGRRKFARRQIVVRVSRTISAENALAQILLRLTYERF